MGVFAWEGKNYKSLRLNPKKIYSKTFGFKYLELSGEQDLIF